MLARTLLLLVLLLFAIAIGSLAMLAEIVRALVGRLHAGWDAWARRRAAAAPDAYEYGGVKLAHAGGILIAAAWLLTGLWIANLSLERLLTVETVPDQLALAVAAVATAARCTDFVGIASGGVVGFVRVRNNLPRAVTILVLFGLTAAALTPDRAVASMIDAAIGLLLGCLLVVVALGNCSAAVRDLIDHPLSASEEQRLANLLHSRGIAPGELVALRSRRAGSELVLEVTLDPRDELVEDACRRIADARAALEGSMPGLRVSTHWLPAD